MTVTQILVILLVIVVAAILVWPHKEEAPLESKPCPAISRPIIKPGDLMKTLKPFIGINTSLKTEVTLPAGTYTICTIEYGYESPQKPQVPKHFIVSDDKDNKRYLISPPEDLEIKSTYPPPRPKAQRVATQ